MNVFESLFKKKQSAPVSADAGSESIDIPKKLPIDENAIRRATKTMVEYRSGKANLERRLVAHEEFWKMRQWDKGIDNSLINSVNRDYRVYSTPWLHSCLESRLADAMDSFPTCNIRPRQKDDTQEAKRLTDIVPVVLAVNDFEETYRGVSRDTLNHGAGIYGIFWDPTLHGGLGDISVKDIDPLNIFTEPGIKDIQKSSNVFLTTLMDNEVIERRYPQTKGKLGGKVATVSKYLFDDNVDTSKKSLLVDWYYHVERGGKKILHLCKYVNDVILFSSENEPGYEEGYYHHGLYPFEVQSLFPVEGSPFGLGLVDTCSSTQVQIDLLNKAIVDNALQGSRPRYFSYGDTSVNEDDFNDPSKGIVRCEGSVDEEHLRQIVAADLPGVYVTYLNNKIEELKFCSANQDVNNGAAPSGVTSGVALAALQENSGKKARDTNRIFHNTYKRVIYHVIELMRQFYDVPRQFRIAPDGMAEEFVQYSNAGLVPQKQMLEGQDMVFRLPEFDIEVTIEKSNSYKKMERNDLAVQLFGLGVFNPQNTDQSLGLLQSMDFDGREDIMELVARNGTMFQQLINYQQIALSLAQKYDPATADQLAQMIMAGDKGITAQMGLDASRWETQKANEETPAMERSRAQARATTEAS